MLRDKTVLIILLFLAIPPSAFCWGFFAHKQINYDAVFLLPPAMISFYKQNIEKSNVVSIYSTSFALFVCPCI